MPAKQLDNRIAAFSRWARMTPVQRQQATAGMRFARDEPFRRAAAELLGPDADPAALAAQATKLRQLHMLRLSRRSAEVRRERKAAAQQGLPD